MRDAMSYRADRSWAGQPPIPISSAAERRALRRPSGSKPRTATLEAEVAICTDAIAMGIRSPAVLRQLQAAETELSTLREQEVVVDAAAAMAAIPVAVTRYRAMVEDLGNAPVDVAAARDQLREMLGEIVLRPEPNRGLVAELRLSEAPIRADAGGCKIDLVAGELCAHIRQCQSGSRLRVDLGGRPAR
jgi:hypothetical protein